MIKLIFSYVDIYYKTNILLGKKEDNEKEIQISYNKFSFLIKHQQNTIPLYRLHTMQNFLHPTRTIK